MNIFFIHVHKIQCVLNKNVTENHVGTNKKHKLITVSQNLCLVSLKRNQNSKNRKTKETKTQKIQKQKKPKLKKPKNKRNHTESLKVG